MDAGRLTFLSDCRASAAVTPEGALVWWPGGRFDGPSAFTRLLDLGAGHFKISPAAPAETTRRYLQDTLVLETEHRAATGVLRVPDAVLFAHGARGHEIGVGCPARSCGSWTPPPRPTRCSGSRTPPSAC
jgi:GH15 family glucan-1,4-alpha-glucosidase